MYWLVCLLLSLVAAKTEWVNNMANRLFLLNTAIVREDITVNITPRRLDPQGDDRYLVVLRPGKLVTSHNALYMNPKNNDKQQLEMSELVKGTDEYVQHCLG
jgi:hypothetical protein